MPNISAGIRFRETNLARITIGSRIHVTCNPTNENAAIIPRMKYFMERNILFLVSFKTGFFLFMLPHRSIIEPKGQTQPQKNLPNTKVNNKTIVTDAKPASIVRPLIDVNIIIRGSILKNVSGGNILFKG